MQRKPLNEIFGQSTKPSLDEIFNIQKPVETESPNYLQRVGAQFERAGERAVSGIQESAQTISSGISKTLQGNVRQGVREMQTGALRGGLRTVGSVAGAAFAPVLEAPGVKQATEAVVSKAVEIPAVQQITQRGMELAQKYPEASKDIEDFINIATLGLGKAATEPIQNIVTESAKSVARLPATVAKQVKSLKGYASNAAEKAIKKDVSDLFTSTRGISNKVKLAEQKGTNLQEIVSDPQIFRGLKVQNGRIAPDEAIEIINSRVEKLLEAKQKTLPEIDRFTPKTPKNVVRERAIANISGKFTPADEADLIKAIDQQLAPLPDELSVQELDSLRAQFRNSARDARGLQKRSSEYSALENATRDTVFDITDNLPIDASGEYKALNQYVKDMLNTKQFLDETLRNQVVKGGRLGNYAMRAVGAVAGSQGGVLGAIGGAEIGGVVADIITNNQLGSSLKMRLIRNITDDPAIIKQAEEMLKKVESYQPKLPAGTPGAPRIQIESGKPIQLPSKTQSTREIEEAQRLSRNMSRQNMATSTTNTISIPKSSNNKEGLSNKLSTAVKKAKKNLKNPRNSQGGFLNVAGKSDDLIQEAKKYKSAEEFVKAQGTPLYHGTTDKSVKNIEKSGFKAGKSGDWGSGIYLTKDKTSASLYGEKLDKSVIQTIIPEKEIYNYSDFHFDKENASLDLARKIIENKSVPETLKSMSEGELAKRIQQTFSTENPKFWLEKAGYKGITDPEKIISQIKDEVVVFDPSIIKTKSQLEEIWKKANKK